MGIALCSSPQFAKAQEWESKKPNVLYAVPKENDDKNTKLNAVKVGIGTATPQSNLHVVGTTTLQGQTNVKGQLFADSATFQQIFANTINTSNNVALRIDSVKTTTITADTARITGLLKVGLHSLYLGASAIGTTGTASNNIFSDNGNLLLQSNAGNIWHTLINNNNTGKVGIGGITTDIPTSKFDVMSGDVRVRSLGQAPVAYNAALSNIVVADANGVLKLNNLSGLGDVKACSPLTAADNNFLTKWTDAANKTICKSLVYDNGTSVSIGASPSTYYKFNVAGKTLNTDPTNAILDLRSTSGTNSVLRLMALDNTSNGITESQIQYRDHFAFASIPANPLVSPTWRFIIDNNGNVGIGITNKDIPVTAKLQVEGTSLFNGNMTINGILNINGNGFISTKQIQTISDQRFKTNINNLPNASAIIKELKPKTYYFDTTNIYGLNFNTEKQYGFIAQDVETILPELVSPTTKSADLDSIGNIIHPEITYKSLNYNAFIGILTKGVQEQSNEIDSLKTAFVALQSQLTQLLGNNTTQLYKTDNIGSTNATNVELNDVQAIVLEQNIPNPFAEQTSISYYLPEATNKAQMLFYNAEGKLIQSTELVQKGKGVLNVFASDLSNGIYTYTLVVDGKITATKQMLKAK